MAKESNNHTLTIGSDTYELQSELTGRGQAGAAGFYIKKEEDSPQQRYLIKEDDPATCLAEGLAIIPTFDSTQTQAPIIQATTHIATINHQSVSVSMQPAFTANNNERPIGLDVFIFQEKRNPKMLISMEQWNASLVQETISKMSDDAKTQLARAIVTSQVNGDESLHTGQFMASINGSNEITKIQRIDMGALGRFALARKDHDPLTTSEKYKSSGQYGKDYVGFLLQDVQVRNKVLDYWHKIKVDEVVKKVTTRFDEQLKNIDTTELKENALQGFYNTLTKGATPQEIEECLKEYKSGTPPLPLDKKVSILLEKTTKKRCEDMQANATIHLIKDALQSQKSTLKKDNPLSSSDKKIISDCYVILNDRKTTPQNRLNTLDKYLNNEEMELKTKGNFLRKIIDTIKKLVRREKNTSPSASTLSDNTESVSTSSTLSSTSTTSTTENFKEQLKRLTNKQPTSQNSNQSSVEEASSSKPLSQH